MATILLPFHAYCCCLPPAARCDTRDKHFSAAMAVQAYPLAVGDKDDGCASERLSHNVYYACCSNWHRKLPVEQKVKACLNNGTGSAAAGLYLQHCCQHTAATPLLSRPSHATHPCVTLLAAAASHWHWPVEAVQQQQYGQRL